MIEESDDGDFDYFDIVIDWGEWLMVILTFSILWLSGECECVVMETRSKEFTYEQFLLWRIWLYRFVETMNEMNEKKETWIRCYSRTI